LRRAEAPNFARRKLLAEEAKEKGISFWEYIKMQVKEVKDAVHGV